MYLTAEVIQEIANTCRDGGYCFTLALRTAERDGAPWYVHETPDQEYERQLREAHAA
jgi:hypothetical protein